jgi:phosphatidylglycerol:prolipoprotein diacylglycerol transferase
MTDSATLAAQSSHWVHDLSPFIIRFSDDFGIRWYGMAYLVGLLCGFWLLTRWWRRDRVPLARPELQDFVLYAGLGMIIGGRLGYVLLYDPGLLVTFDDEIPWWGLLAVNHGGMASHGGIAGLFAGTWLFAWRRRRSLPVLMDVVAATAPLGVVLGRIANFINGELWGRVSDVAWAVIFPNAADHPKQLTGAAAYAWQVANAIPNPPRHPSQLYAAVCEGLIILAIALPVHARHRRPGLTTGLVLTLYALGRFFDEFFREPDHGRFFIDWMTKGQAFSIPVLLIGIGLMVWAARRPARLEAYLPPVATDGQ